VTVGDWAVTWETLSWESVVPMTRAERTAMRPTYEAAVPAPIATADVTAALDDFADRARRR